MLELALQKLRAEPETTAIVGDGLETDIPGGQRLGLMTILVLSGVTSPEQLARSPLQPDLVYPDIAALHRAWTEALRPSKHQSRDTGTPSRHQLGEAGTPSRVPGGGGEGRTAK